MKLLRLAIQAPHHCTKYNLQDSIAAQSCPAFSQEGHCVDDVSHVFVVSNVGEIVVKFLEMLSSFPVIADLEELHADLPRRSFELVKLLRSLYERALDVVRGNAISDADDVDRLGVLRILLIFVEIPFKDLLECASGWRCTAGSDCLEDFLYFACTCHIVMG